MSDSLVEAGKNTQLERKAGKLYEYDSARRRLPVVEEFIELLRYRDLLVLLISRNIKIRYKRSILGLAWTMLNPLMMMIIMTLVFSSIFAVAVHNYAVYVLSGLILWNFFSQTTVAATNELVWGGNLMTRIYVPPTAFAITAIGTGLVNILLSLVPLLLIMLVTGAPFSFTILLLPVSIIFVAMFALGLSLLLSTLAIYFTDVLEMYQVILLGWFYLTPIIYPMSMIPQRYVWLLSLNPMYGLLEIFRSPLLQGELPSLMSYATTGLMSITTLLVGWWFFARKADEIAYRI